MCRIFLLLIICIRTSFCTAQLHLQKCDQVSLTPRQLVEDHFLKSGVKIIKVSYQLHRDGSGIFTDEKSLLGFKDGIVLATGNIDSLPGPNKRFGTSSHFKGIDSYMDDDFRTKGKNYDAMMLNIEFIPMFDSICFEYCFGSEEYPEFVNSDFNDLFVLYLKPKGSKITDNLALLPNKLMVCINTVNHKKNKEYFIDNTADYQFNKISKQYEPLNRELFTVFEYDGFTKVLTAGSNLVSGKVYELKIIICDLNDANFDSGVFLKSHSFRSIPAAFVNTQKTSYKKFIYYFNTASFVPDSIMLRTIPDLSDYIRKNKIDFVYLSGHTDSTGRNDSNILLSMNRANYIKKLLTNEGIDEHIIRTFGKSSGFPVKSNATKEGRELNRRVEIILYKK